MFSFLTSKPLILALILSISCNALLFGVSKHLYDAKAKAVGEVGVLKQTLSDQLISSNKAETACVIDNSKAAEFQEGKKALENVEKEALDIVSKLPDKPQESKALPKVSKDVQQNDIASLDSKLSPELVSVLKGSFDSVQGQGTRHP